MYFDDNDRIQINYIVIIRSDRTKSVTKQFSEYTYKQVHCNFGGPFILFLTRSLTDVDIIATDSVAILTLVPNHLSSRKGHIFYLYFPNDFHVLCDVAYSRFIFFGHLQTSTYPCVLQIFREFKKMNSKARI